MEILKITDLTFTYPLCQTPAIDSVSFSVNKGDFCVVCGDTGSGKSTLLRLLKPALSPLGEKSGEVLFCGVPLEELSERDAASRIGFVMQRPEQQIVTDKVWHELAFGLENMGTPHETIARRIAEMASYFGIEAWYDKSVNELSGGQKQLLNLASVMVMDPDVLILDEPTAQLDPIAAADFLATLKKLCDELSLTVLIVEHRLEDLIPMCDKMVVLKNGKLQELGAPRDVVARLDKTDELALSMPAAARLYLELAAEGECPMTLKEGRRFIENNYSNAVSALPREECSHSPSVALELKDVYFRYERDLPDVLGGTSLTVYENEIFCILGGNGSGKTTALSVAAGLLRPYSGYVRVFGKKLKDYKNSSLYRECLTLLPQDVQTVFLKNTVREELEEAGAILSELPFDLSGLVDMHPYDLSGGEQQLVALAKVLATKPRLLLMDEPTKGLDAAKKRVVADILANLKANGVTVVIVTHDVEFTALCADRCALFFGGDAIAADTPARFFSDNCFYTTAASRMSKGYYDGAVTVEELAALCRLNAQRGGREE